jgi:H/ACA ribonucleoprotein complex subunit 3
MKVMIEGKCRHLKLKDLVGQGGEAEVYALGKKQAVKVFKSADHPDYAGQESAQEGARQRLQEHQFKLKQFPQGLPERVISPQSLVTDPQSGSIIGYTMRLLPQAEKLMRYGERSFRQQGIPGQKVVEIFKDLHLTLTQLHQAGIVIGDFNDLNILIFDTVAYVIDTDSFQFQGFPCRMFTTTFLDPLLCDPASGTVELSQPYTSLSDWYAFSVLLFQSLLCVGPYGGVYKPKDPQNRIPHHARSLQRITIFHDQVRYPPSAIHFRNLPDDLLHYFQQVFEKDLRQPWPQHLLNSLAWTTCIQCGTEHARSICPACLKSGAVKQVIKVRGSVTATTHFQTRGVILTATYQKGQLIWLYHEKKGMLRRENGEVVVTGELGARVCYHLQHRRTWIGQRSQVIGLNPDQPMERISTDVYAHQPVVATNSRQCYWVQAGQLFRSGIFGPELLGDVLHGQTQIWVGESFGFGIYRASHLRVGFVFQADQKGLNDAVPLQVGRGEWLQATCYFSTDRCWLFLATQEQGRTVHWCQVIQPDGRVIASATAERGDGSWLGSLRGKCAFGHELLAVAEEGIVRVACQQGQLLVIKSFPDTEPFVDPDSQLFTGDGGIWVIRSQSIQHLQMN